MCGKQLGFTDYELTMAKEPTKREKFFSETVWARCSPSSRQTQSHSLVIDSPALPCKEAVGHPAAPANVIRSDLAEPMAELGLLKGDSLAAMALGAVVLTHHAADEALRSPERSQNRDGPASVPGLEVSLCKVGPPEEDQPHCGARDVSSSWR